MSPSPVSLVGAWPSECTRGPRGGNSLPATARCSSRRCPQGPRVGISLGSAKHSVPSCRPVSPGCPCAPRTGIRIPGSLRVPLLSPRSPGTSYLSRGSPSIPVPPGPGYESMSPLTPMSPCPSSTPCLVCPPAQVVLFPGMSVFPGMSPFPGCPLSREVLRSRQVPLPGTAFQGGHSARGVPLSGIIPFPRYPLSRGVSLPGTFPFPGTSLCPGCHLSRNVPLPRMSPCGACPLSTAVSLPL